MRSVTKHTNMSAQFEDHNLVEQETRKSGLDWDYWQTGYVERGETGGEDIRRRRKRGKLDP